MRRDRTYEWNVAKSIAIILLMLAVGGVFVCALLWWVQPC